MRKDLIVRDTRVGGTEARVLTTRNIAGKLLEIMTGCIGYDNMISRAKLFQKLFGHKEEDTLKDWLRWEFAKKGMHYCRLYTKCFIGSTRIKDQWVYFVAKEYSDAMLYCNTLDRNIKAMEDMKKRAIKSVKEGWFNSKWELPLHTKVIEK